MRALIVVESWFGNTLAVAEAVADGLSPFMAAEIRNVDEAPAQLVEGVDLVVVGGPTHAFGMSRPNTRRDAAQQAGVSAGTVGGVREWLESGPSTIRRAAAFDTRIDKGWVPGSAARGIAKRLHRLGATLVADPESFRVTGTPGPLAAGELGRARRWGEQLAAVTTAAGTQSSTR